MILIFYKYGEKQGKIEKNWKKMEKNKKDREKLEKDGGKRYNI